MGACFWVGTGMLLFISLRQRIHGAKCEQFSFMQVIGRKLEQNSGRNYLQEKQPGVTNGFWAGI